MSRCFGEVEADRINTAAALILGFLLYFNKGEKSTKILEKVQWQGFSQQETFEALQILTTARIVESHHTRRLFKSRSLRMTDYAKAMPVSDLFKKVNDSKGSMQIVNQIANFVGNHSEDIAKIGATAITLV